MNAPASSLTLREPRKPQDYPALADVLNASNPAWPVTPELLRTWDEARDPALFNTQLVAELGGRIVGAGGIGHDDFAFEEWRYFGNLAVHPDVRGQGVGTALYDGLLRRVRGRGAREVRTMISDEQTDAPGRAFVEKRGFAVVWERYESRLDTRATDLARFDDLLASVAADGVEFRSLTELRAEPERNRWLWELDWELFQDVPMGETLTKRPLEVWAKQELEDPTLAPDLSFVAVRPELNDPLTGPYIGYSTLGRNPSGFYYIGMTGVKRADRGKGIAKALKVAAMRALHALGGGEIRTFNDPPNVAMLGMNEALGFVRHSRSLRYELKLEDV
ncbi:GNAT family N-acetyltransferase [Deinococcus frigens]|uniref:GNAT family N-acetyltransferase n=1 Tax=Deinococcus frigens TaxID=249403 RepID=UPI000497D704|nr:GNAT family N-acetyltransferase [Deinococcus frigens]